MGRRTLEQLTLQFSNAAFLGEGSGMQSFNARRGLACELLELVDVAEGPV